MSDTDLPATPNQLPTEPICLSDAEKTVATEAVRRFIVFLAAHGKAVSLVRYAVVAACGHEATVSDSTISQTAAYLVGAATIAWSWWERHKQAHEAAARASAKLPTKADILPQTDNNPSKDRP